MIIDLGAIVVIFEKEKKNRKRKLQKFTSIKTYQRIGKTYQQFAKIYRCLERIYQRIINY